jgi:hypothetical protein
MTPYLESSTSWTDDSLFEISLLAQGGRGVKSRGALGRKPGCKCRNAKEHDGHAGESHGVRRLHAHQHRRDHAGKNKGCDCPNADADGAQTKSLQNNKTKDMASFRSQSHAYADLGGALPHCGRKHAVKANPRQRSRNYRKHRDEQQREPCAGLRLMHQEFRRCHFCDH